MRQAIAIAGQRGLLERVHGRGTFSPTVLAPACCFLSLPRRVAAAATTADEVPQSRIVGNGAQCPAKVTTALGLPPGSRCEPTRVRSLNARPACMDLAAAADV